MAASNISSRALDSRCSARAEDPAFDRLFDIVERILKEYAPDTQEASDDVVQRQICKSLRKGAKSCVDPQKPLHENIWQFCNKAFESLFAGMSNHKILHRIDWIHPIDIAMKESFPTQYLLDAGIQAYQSELEWACDAAFEAQRFEYITWDILPQFFSEKKKWKKLSTILDQARLKGLLWPDHPFADRCGCWVEKYTSTWMNYVVSEWKALARNYTLNAPTKIEVVAIFWAVLQEGGLPQEMERETGLPSKAFIEQAAGWILDDQEVPVQSPRKLKSEIPVRPEGGGLRQRARGRHEGYGKGTDPGGPILSRTLLSPPPVRMHSELPARSAHQMFPSRSPSLSPRRDAYRKHYGVEDAAEMPEFRREERHPASPASDADTHSTPADNSHSSFRHRGLAAGARVSRIKEELPDQLEDSGDNAGDGDDFAYRNPGDPGGSQSSRYGEAGSRPRLAMSMKEELQECQGHQQWLREQSHSTGTASGNQWRDPTPVQDGGEDASTRNCNRSSSADSWDRSAWSGAWADQQKEKPDNKSWSGWNTEDSDRNWQGEAAEASSQPWKDRKFWNREDEDFDEQGSAKRRRADPYVR